MGKELPKIDLKDKKILALLEKDARTPASAIAKKVGLSKPAVSSRIARLVKEGVIEHFLLHVNLRALSSVNFRLYVKFQSTPANFEQELEGYLRSDGRVRWFCICQGEWDIIIRALASDIYEFRQFEREFLLKFGKHVLLRSFATIVDDAYHNCTYITGNEGSNSDPQKDYADVKAKISPQEAKILYWLFENSRMPFSELAQKTSLSAEAASYHVKKLEKEGVITGFMAKIGRPSTGYNESKVLFWFQYPTPQSVLRFRKYCESHQYVSFFGEIIGAWDMEVDFDVKDNRHLYEILQKMRNRFGELIRDCKVLVKIREVEVNFMARRAGIGVPKSR